MEAKLMLDGDVVHLVQLRLFLRLGSACLRRGVWVSAVRWESGVTTMEGVGLFALDVLLDHRIHPKPTSRLFHRHYPQMVTRKHPKQALTFISASRRSLA